MLCSGFRLSIHPTKKRTRFGFFVTSQYTLCVSLQVCMAQFMISIKKSADKIVVFNTRVIHEYYIILVHTGKGSSEQRSSFLSI